MARKRAPNFGLARSTFKGTGSRMLARTTFLLQNFGIQGEQALSILAGLDMLDMEILGMIQDRDDKPRLEAEVELIKAMEESRCP